MKRIGLAFLGLLFLAQCAEKSIEKEINEELEIKILSEEIQPYALTPIDSVYSVHVKVTSTDSILAQYNVSVVQGNTTFKDSLVFEIPAGDEITGEFIFPDCRVKNNPKPTFSSQIKRVHDR